MEKDRVCMNSRTINLAKQTCPDKSHLLVYQTQKPPEPHKSSCHGKTPISSAPATQIRVCTGAELKKMCRPKPCVCPPVATKGQSLTRLLGFGLKTALVGSLLYWTSEAGLWGDSEETEMFYTNICHLFTEGYIKERSISKACQLELDLRKSLPEKEDQCSRAPINKERTIYRFKETWNYVITEVFEGAAGFPFNFIAWLRKTDESEPCTPRKR